MNWFCKTFDLLTPLELYSILQLRNEVFVVEQQCVFQDADNKDQYCLHLMGWEQNLLVAYSRIVPAGVSYSESSIGRIVTSPRKRGEGVGRELVRQSLNMLYAGFGRIPVRIGAQFYLKTFYESFGFKQISNIYIEDDIQHIEMLLSPT
jgi:ElaA protein